jgi:acyl carrier protein
MSAPIEQTVFDYAAKAYMVEPEKIAMETTIKEIGGNSIKTIGFKSMLEEQYDIVITLDESSACKTMGDFVKLIEAKVN